MCIYIYIYVHKLLIFCHKCLLYSVNVSVFQQLSTISTSFIDHPSEGSLHGTALTELSCHLTIKIDDTANITIDPSITFTFPQTSGKMNTKMYVNKSLYIDRLFLQTCNTMFEIIEFSTSLCYVTSDLMKMFWFYDVVLSIESSFRSSTSKKFYVQDVYQLRA